MVGCHETEAQEAPDARGAVNSAVCASGHMAVTLGAEVKARSDRDDTKSVNATLKKQQSVSGILHVASTGIEGKGRCPDISVCGKHTLRKVDIKYGAGPGRRAPALPQSELEIQPRAGSSGMRCSTNSSGGLHRSALTSARSSSKCSWDRCGSRTSSSSTSKL